MVPVKKQEADSKALFIDVRKPRTMVMRKLTSGSTKEIAHTHPDFALEMPKEVNGFCVKAAISWIAASLTWGQYVG